MTRPDGALLVQIDWTSLYAALPAGADSRSWQVMHIAPAHLRVEGSADVRRLNIVVDLYLIGSGQNAANRVRVALRSEPWSQNAELPPAQDPFEVTTAVLAGDDSPLRYTLHKATPRQLEGHPVWLQYLHPARALVATADDETPGRPLEETLPTTLGHWLSGTLKVATVGAARHTAQHGPLGHFGPTESIVLERSGEADLAVDATLLAEVDDASEQGDDATTRLRLYGERFGLWLLHRCVSPRTRSGAKSDSKSGNKRPPRGVPVQQVLMAKSPADLIQLAGLAPLEKRLFQAAGILAHARLWRDSAADGEASTATEAGAPQLLDISAVADRSRRPLQNLVTLAQQGKLTSADMDLLFRLARQLSRAR